MFKLASLQERNGGVVGALVLGDDAFELSTLQAAFADSPAGRSRLLSSTTGIRALLDAWEENFDVLQAMAAFVQVEGGESDRLKVARRAVARQRLMAPVLRPSKMLYGAANYSAHIAEMRRTNFTGPLAHKSTKDSLDKATTSPYMFLKAPNTLAGPFDDIVIPRGTTRIDWEGELALAIGRPGKRIKAERALDHVAGYMTTNDVSCRDFQYRSDWPTMGCDWLTGKSHDTFAPMGPYLVPKAFVPNYGELRLVLSVNGEIKQDGLIGDIIFSPEEQIEFASRTLTLESGDVFAAGTIGGVGQGMGQFLQPGDVVENEITGLGKQRNKVVSDQDTANA